MINIDKTHASIPIFIILIAILNSDIIPTTLFEIFLWDHNTSLKIVQRNLLWIYEYSFDMLTLKINTKFFIFIDIDCLECDVGETIVLRALVESEMEIILYAILLHYVRPYGWVYLRKAWKWRRFDFCQKISKHNIYLYWKTIKNGKKISNSQYFICLMI